MLVTSYHVGVCHGLPFLRPGVTAINGRRTSPQTGGNRVLMKKRREVLNGVFFERRCRLSLCNKTGVGRVVKGRDVLRTNF